LLKTTENELTGPHKTVVQHALYKTCLIAATPEDHQVVGEQAKGDLAFLAVGAAGPKGGTEPPLEHREDRFHLPSLAVGFLRKAAGGAC